MKLYRLICICIFFSCWFVAESTAQSLIEDKNRSDIAEVDLSVDTAVDSLIWVIRKATERFKDQKAAETAGYRKMGPDMPNMGVHWIHLGLAVNRSFDLSRPSTLTYVEINGEQTLTGAAFTIPVQPGETPPELPVEEMKWHYHSGHLEMEAYGLHQDSDHQEEAEKVRLAMIHAWVWVENPEGYFEPDNWALSYVRLGFKPPEKPSAAASKALYLAQGGVDYFSRFVELAIHPQEIDMVDIREIIRHYAVKVNEMSDSWKKSKLISKRDHQALEKIWESMWDDIKSKVNKETWMLIARHLGPSHSD